MNVTIIIQLSGALLQSDSASVALFSNGTTREVSRIICYDGKK